MSEDGREHSEENIEAHSGAEGNSAERESDEKNNKFYKFTAGKGVMNLPNKLTISRIVMIPIFVVFFYVQFTGHYFVALAVFVIASLTDLIDGKIARKYKLVTNLGKFLDPIADKVLVAAAFILILTRPEIFTELMGDPAIIIAGCGIAAIIARELVISGFRMVAASADMVIAADAVGKVKTTFQDICLIVLLAGVGIAELIGYDAIASRAVLYTGFALFLIAVLLTIISGINYIVKNSAVLKK